MVWKADDLVMPVDEEIRQRLDPENRSIREAEKFARHISGRRIPIEMRSIDAIEMSMGQLGPFRCH